MPDIILDRDGVINYESAEYIKTPDELHPIPGSLEAIAKLNRHGFRVFIATNQSGIARGLYDVDMLNSIHTKLIEELRQVKGKITDIFFCPHHPSENCFCRKPKPGLLKQIQQKYILDFSKTFFIGDSIVDFQAAISAGCLPMLVLTGRGQTHVTQYPELQNVPTFLNLRHSVDFILSQGEHDG